MITWEGYIWNLSERNTLRFGSIGKTRIGILFTEGSLNWKRQSYSQMPAASCQSPIQPFKKISKSLTLWYILSFQVSTANYFLHNRKRYGAHKASLQDMCVLAQLDCLKRKCWNHLSALVRDIWLREASQQRCLIEEVTHRWSSFETDSSDKKPQEVA